MSEETKEKLRLAAQARKEKAITAHGEPTASVVSEEQVSLPINKKRSDVDFDGLVRKHPSNTLRQIYAMKITQMPKAEAFAESIKMLGDRP